MSILPNMNWAIMNCLKTIMGKRKKKYEKSELLMLICSSDEWYSVNISVKVKLN